MLNIVYQLFIIWNIYFLYYKLFLSTNNSKHFIFNFFINYHFKLVIINFFNWFIICYFIFDYLFCFWLNFETIFCFLNIFFSIIFYSYFKLDIFKTRYNILFYFVKIVSLFVILKNVLLFFCNYCYNFGNILIISSLFFLINKTKTLFLFN